jgi:hypothetical protein
MYLTKKSNLKGPKNIHAMFCEIVVANSKKKKNKLKGSKLFLVLLVRQKNNSIILEFKEKNIVFFEK